VPSGRGSSFAIITIGGERAWVCDEAIVAYTEGGQPIGMATISPEGEDQSGQPEIVGVFVLPGHRRQGIGLELLRQALQRCAERDFRAVRMTVATKMGARLVARLPTDLPVIIKVNDQSAHSPF